MDKWKLGEDGDDELFHKDNESKKMSNVSINMALQNKDGADMSDVEILPNHPVKFMAVFFDINPNSKNYSITIFFVL